MFENLEYFSAKNSLFQILYNLGREKKKNVYTSLSTCKGSRGQRLTMCVHTGIDYH